MVNSNNKYIIPSRFAEGAGESSSYIALTEGAGELLYIALTEEAGESSCIEGAGESFSCIAHEVEETMPKVNTDVHSERIFTCQESRKAIIP